MQDLPRLIADDLPGVELTICTSAHQTVEMLSRSTYSVVIAAGSLVQAEPALIVRHERNRHALVPVVVTAAQADLALARDALLHRGAFDVITRPIDPEEALISIRTALWQAEFLQLLTQEEQGLDNFQRHLETYLEDRELRTMVNKVLERPGDAMTHVQTSIKMVDARLDGLLIELAASVEEWIKDQALTRLDRLKVERLWM